MVDIVDLILQTSNLPPISLLIILLVGYSFIFTMFYRNKKIWDKFGGTDKIILSSIIGLGFYYLSFLSLSLIFQSNGFLFNEMVPIPIITSYTILFSESVICMLWLYFLIKEIDIKTILVKSLKYFYYGFICIIVASILIGIVTFFTPYRMISLQYIFYSLLLSIPLYVIGIFKKILSKKGKTSFNKYTAEFLKRYFLIKLLIVAIVVILIFGAFRAILFPSITYYEKTTSLYYFDGGEYQIEYLNRQPDLYVWKAYRLVSKPTIIHNSGIFGWLPLEYNNIIEDDLTTESQQKFSVLINTTEGKSYTVYISNPYKYTLDILQNEIGIKNITLDSANKKILLHFDKFKELSVNKIKSINLIGWEYTENRNFSIVEGNPSVAENWIVLYTNFTNNLDSDAEFHFLTLSQFARYKSNWEDCKISSYRAYEFNSTHNQNLITDMKCNENGGCSGRLDYANPEFYFDGSKNLILRSIYTKSKSTLSLIIALDCKK